MSAAVKTCTKCGVCKSVEEFHRQRDGALGRQSRCKACKADYRVSNADYIRTYKAERYRQQRGHVKVQSAERYQRHRQLRIAQAAAWANSNPERRKAIRNNYYARDRDALGDQYVKSLIAQDGIPRDLIPQPLIEAKRQHIALQRLIKERTKP